MGVNGIMMVYGIYFPTNYGDRIMKYKKIAALLLAVCLSLSLFISCTPSVAAVEETYEMSAAYKKSKYYENFKSLELSGDGAHDVLAIALSQLGYHEGNSNADLDGMNTSGTRDFVEYNVLYGKLDNNQGNGISYGYYWCASFVNWCLRQARVSAEASAAQEVSCQRWLKKCDQAGIYHAKEGYTPKSADMIFFKDKGSAVAATHMGLVLYCYDGIVCTIEGNTSNDNSFSSDGNYVAIKTYSLDSEYIVGYATPEYEKAPVEAVDRTPFSMSPGSYISSDKIKIYSNGKEIAEIDAYETFSVTEIGADGFAVSYEKNGKTYQGFAEIEEKALQMTASGGDFITVDFLSSGKKIFNTYYLLEGTEARTPDVRPKMEGAGFVSWVELQDPTVSKYPDTLSAGDVISLKGDHISYSALWDTALYTVTFKDEDGKVIQEIQGYLGESFIVPTITDLPEGIYFDGWGADNISGIITGSAVYTAEIRDETPWGRFVESSPLTLGVSLSVAFIVLGTVMLIILYRKKPDEG